MGEKEIVQDTVGSGGTGLVGGGPPVTGPGGQVGQPAGPDSPGGPGGGSPPGGKPTSDGPGGGGGGQQATDCAEMQARFEELQKALEALRQKNQDFSDKAIDAFFRNEGYRDTVQRTKVTDAVVTSNNQTGKNLIEIALFAAGGYSGLAGGGGAGWSKVGGKWAAPTPSAAAATMEGMFGKGIYGSKDATGAIQGIGAFLGKMTGADLGGKAVEGGPLTDMANNVKNTILDGLGDWMKEGATGPGVEAAKGAYAEFMGKATAANAAAAGAADVRKQMEDVIAEAQKKGCPPFGTVPDPIIRTFDLVAYGLGAERNQGGPNVHKRTMSGSNEWVTDMFKAGSKGMLA